MEGAGVPYEQGKFIEMKKQKMKMGKMGMDDGDALRARGRRPPALGIGEGDSFAGEYTSC
jgi:hypothetical protein